MSICYPDFNLNAEIQPSDLLIEDFFNTSTNSKTDVKDVKNVNNSKNNRSDGVNSLYLYPFNTKTEGNSKMVYLSLNNTNVRVRDNRIVSNRPILVKVENGVLFIWNTEHKDYFTQNSKGYEIKDFDGRKIKVNQRYEFLTWNIPKIKMKYVELKGNNSNVIFDDSVFEKDADVYVLGKNNCSFDKNSFESLKVFTNNSRVKFNDSYTNTANLTVNGSGKIKGLTVVGKLDTKIFGNGNIKCKNESSSLTSKPLYL